MNVNGIYDMNDDERLDTCAVYEQANEFDGGKDHERDQHTTHHNLCDFDWEFGLEVENDIKTHDRNATECADNKNYTTNNCHDIHI